MKKLILHLIFLCSLPLTQIAQTLSPVCFMSPISYDGGSSANSIATADFNNDGIKDIVVGNTIPPYKVSVFIGLGNGLLTPTSTLSVNNPNSAPIGIVTADFNNDGKTDIATADALAHTITVYVGLGNGNFMNPVSYFCSLNYNSGICTADFNLDGKADLACAGFNSNSISVLLNNGTATFSTSVSYPVGTNPRRIQAGDFNADGNKDLAVSNYGSASVSVLMGTSTGTFIPAVTYSTSGLYPDGVATGDFNNDGKSDLICVHTGSNNMTYFQSTSSGTLAPPINYVLGYLASSITAADFNNDTNLDFAITQQTGNSIIAFRGNGLGTFNFGAFASVGNSSSGSCSGDFNNDGKMDLAVVGTTTTPTSLAMVLNGPIINPSSGILCTGANNVFTITPSGASTYTFSSGTNMVSPTTTTNYTVMGTNIAGCTNTAICSVTVNATPTVSANAILTGTGNIICSGESATLTANGANTYSWSNSATNNSITVSPTITTTYSVYGISNSCTGLVAITSVSVNACVGIYEYNNSIIYKVYPNPTNTYLNIELEENTELQITDVIGKIINEFRLQKGENTINTSQLSNGIYYFKLKQGNRLSISKIIKQ